MAVMSKAVQDLGSPDSWHGSILVEGITQGEHHMSLEQLANAGEALGGLAVLLSLIYLIINCEDPRERHAAAMHGTLPSPLPNYVK